MSDDEDDYPDEHESGPFCRHWSDPGSCEETCGACHHSCNDHDEGTPGACRVDGCTCAAWADSEEPPPSIATA